MVFVGFGVTQTRGYFRMHKTIFEAQAKRDRIERAMFDATHGMEMASISEETDKVYMVLRF